MDEFISTSDFTTDKKEEKDDNAGNNLNGKRSSEFSYSSKKDVDVIEKKKSLENIGFRSDVSPNTFLTNYYNAKYNFSGNSCDSNELNLFEQSDNNSKGNKKDIVASHSEIMDKKAKDITDEFFDFSIKGNK